MIGGNIIGNIRVSTSIKNKIGENIHKWATVHSQKGFLDLSSGDSKYINNNAKIQESTHVFICDYFVIDKRVKAESSIMVIDGLRYDVMLIDDPMGLHQHYEIYLKFTGGQDA